jgi:hypothetical protein
MPIHVWKLILDGYLVYRWFDVNVYRKSTDDVTTTR